jgi:hypothetical protein
MLIAIGFAGLSLGIWIYLDDVHKRGCTLESVDQVRLLIELVDTPELVKERPRILISQLTPSSHGETPYTEQGTIESHCESLRELSECSSARLSVKRNLLRMSMVH